MPVPKNNFTQAGFRQIQVQGSKQSTPKPLASFQPAQSLDR